VFDRQGNVVSVAQKEFGQIYPQPGWVEHDPQEIWSTQAGVAAEAVTRAGLNGASIAAIGITNQRETTIVWDRETGQPIYNAIVWQDRRTADFCDQLKAQGLEEKVRAKTGLPIDSYFSATKIRWILDNVEGAREKAKQGRLAFGTVDSWLVWNFTKHGLHITDVTNASRTMLFNIHTLKWDDELLDALDIPRSMLPEVRASSEVYGPTKTTVFASKIPLAGIAGDQHAALFGQMCTKSGMVKNTYGTGCFLVMNTGDKPIESRNNLVTLHGRSATRSTMRWKAASLSAALSCNGSATGLASSRVPMKSKRLHAACRIATASIWCQPLQAWAPRTGMHAHAARCSA
jgi:glycerol kinase